MGGTVSFEGGVSVEDGEVQEWTGPITVKATIAAFEGLTRMGEQVGGIIQLANGVWMTTFRFWAGFTDWDSIEFEWPAVPAPVEHERILTVAGGKRFHITRSAEGDSRLTT